MQIQAHEPVLDVCRGNKHGFEADIYDSQFM